MITRKHMRSQSGDVKIAMATMSQKIADGPRRKNRREIGSTETGSLPMLENPSPFPNGLGASGYLAKLLGIELKTDGLSISPSQLILSESAPVTPMECSRPLVIELFAGSFGWSAGFISEGFRSIGFDIEHEAYHGPVPQHATLVIKDVLELNGAWFKNASALVCSPPCQEFSYMAMPWSRAKAIACEYRSGKRDTKKLTALFGACFRIQREAIEAAGHFIPMVVENVRGAQPWVGKARWNFGSYYLWGDVPALMPTRPSYTKDHAWKNNDGELNGRKHGPSPGKVWKNRPPSVSAHREHARHLTNQAESDGVKHHASGPVWFDTGPASTGSKSSSRKAASATIAKIPFPLAHWIAHVWKPKHPITEKIR